MHDKIQAAKNGADVVAGIGTVGTVLGYLPTVVAFLAATWYCIQIHEWAKRNGIYNKIKKLFIKKT